jgi:hypothetical protein
VKEGRQEERRTGEKKTNLLEPWRAARSAVVATSSAAAARRGGVDPAVTDSA